MTTGVKLTPLTSSKWRIENLGLISGQSGSYELTVTAQGLVDLVGNAGSGTQTVSWTLDTAKPASPSNLRLSPDLGSSNNDGRTSTQRVTLSGTLGEAGVSVAVFDATTGSDLGLGKATGTTFARELNLTPAGAHRLRVRAVDAAGNVSPDAFVDVFTDLVPPTATIQGVTPNVRTEPVLTLDITFSEPINPATLTSADLSLRRDEGANLIGPSVGIAAVGDTTFRISGLGTLTDAPGSYSFSLNLSGVEDAAGVKGEGNVTRTWLRKGSNTAPQLAAIVDRRVSPETLLTLTNRVTDIDKPGDLLGFALGPGAPAGAVINKTTGVFSWRPSRQQANTVASIQIIVTDNGTPPLSDSQTFTVVVEDFIEITLDSGLVPSGEAGSIPIHLSSSAACTELVFVLPPLDPRLTEPVILATDPANVSATILEVGGDRSLTVGFTTAPGVTLTGDQIIGSLQLRAAPGLRSEFIRMSPRITTSRAGTRDTPNSRGVAGRAIVIGREPLFDTPSVANNELFLSS